MKVCHDHDSWLCEDHAVLIDRLWTQEYDDLLDEFMMACKQAYGEKVLVQVRYICS